MRIPYRRKFRRGKVTKFWLGDNNFHRQIFLPDEFIYLLLKIEFIYYLSIIIYYYLLLFKREFIYYLFICSNLLNVNPKYFTVNVAIPI